MAERVRQTVVQVTQLHRHLGELIRKVALSDEHYVVEKGGLPVAVMMSMAEYEKLTGEARIKEFRSIARSIGEEIERQGYTEEQVLEQLEKTRQRLYQETYGKAKTEK